MNYNWYNTIELRLLKKKKHIIRYKYATYKSAENTTGSRKDENFVIITTGTSWIKTERFITYFRFLENRSKVGLKMFTVCRYWPVFSRFRRYSQKSFRIVTSKTWRASRLYNTHNIQYVSANYVMTEDHVFGMFAC